MTERDTSPTNDAGSGQLRPTDLVKREVMPDWVEASSVEGTAVPAREGPPPLPPTAPRPMMTDGHWYIRLGAEELGPVSSQELVILAGQGALKPDTQVSTDRSTWRDAATVAGLCFAPAQPTPSGIGPAENEWIAAVRSRVKMIVNDLLHMDFRKDVIPLDADNLKLLAKDFTFWAAMFLGVVPLFIHTLEGLQLKLTAFAIFFAVVWGVIFKLFVIRDGGDWKMPIAALLFTGVVGIPVLLHLIYPLFIPQAILNLPFSQNHLVSLIGWVAQVGVCEEICKITPVVAYVFWKRSSAKPFTIILVGVFSGLGFAAFENMRWFDTWINKELARTAEEGKAGAMFMALTRSLANVFGHAVWSGIFAYFVAAASVFNRRWGALFLVGLGIVAILHGVYDWLCFLQPTMAAATSALSFVLFCGYLTKLRGILATSQGTQTSSNGPGTRLLPRNGEPSVG